MTINTLYPAVNPTLNLDFSNTKVLDPRITFGRSSTALAYDGKTTVKAEENLLWYSQAIDNAGAWSKVNTTATGNYAVAPDGTTTAGALAETTANTTHYLAQSATVSAGAYTLSVYLKKGDGATAPDWIRVNITAGNIGANFNLATGIVGNVSAGVTAAISSAGNSWYRCSITYTASAGSLGFYLGFTGNADASSLTSYAGVITANVFVWGIQLEGRSSASAYTVTTGAAITNYIPALQSYAANVARFDFNPVTGESLGLMVEEQRTNLVSYSQDFWGGLAWTGVAASVQANCAIAPDGTFTADKLTEDSTNATHYLTRSATTAVANATVYTASMYVKALGQTTVRLQDTAAASAYADFNLSTLAITNQSNGVGAITSVGNGWYRIAMTYTSGGTTALIRLTLQTGSYAGNGYSGVLIWGAQLEAGAFATSYVPTLLTYSGRGSVGTYIGDNGLIQTAQANVARYQRNVAGAVQLLLEGAASNLLTYTRSFDQWAYAVNGATVYPACAIAPDGTFTACKAVLGSADYRYQAFGTTTITTYTGSIYLRADSPTTVGLRITNNAGTEVTVATCNVTTQWQRFTASKTMTVSLSSVQIGLEQRTAIGGPGSAATVYVWGGQLETGSVATSYIPSTDTFTSRSGSASYFDPSGVLRYAPAGLARYDFDPVTGLSKGLLLEATATNLVLQSADLAASPWTASGASVTSNSTVAPDGTTTADTVTFTATATDNVNQAITLTAAAYTISWWVKTASGTKNFRIKYNNGTTDIYSTDLTATTVWTRFTLTVTGTASAGVVAIANDSAAGAGSVIAWGAQVEAGAFATSYIPTTSAQVTRAADSASSVANSRAADVWSSAQATRVQEDPTMTGTNFSQWYRRDEGTFYSEQVVYASGDGNSRSALAVSNGSGSSSAINILASYGGTNRPRVLGYNNSTLDGDIYPAATYAAGAFHKFALAFKTNDYALSGDGAAVATDTAVSVPTVDRLMIGADGSGAGRISGTIKRIAFYPKRLSNTEIAGLTS